MNPYDLRTPDEKRLDEMFEAHLNYECHEDCEWCDEINQMVNYWTKQEDK